VHSEAQYLSELRRNYLNGGCFLSLYTDAQIERGIVDCIFLEIDAHTVDEAVDKCVQIREKLDEINAKYRIFFSGRRSFHFYVEFAPVQLKNPRMSIRKFVEKFPSFLDPHVVGNLRQMVRIPYTVHKKTALFSFEVGAEEVSTLTNAQIFKWATNPKKMRTVDRDVSIDSTVSEQLKKTDEQLSAAPKIEVIYEHMSKKSLEEDPFPPCVVQALSKLQEEGESTHAERLLISSFLIKKGYTDREVLSIFAQCANDFDERQTSYQLSKIRSGQMACYACRSLLRRGLCTYAQRDAPRCSWHPNINRYI
jgi:hypothetical protein